MSDKMKWHPKLASLRSTYKSRMGLENVLVEYGKNLGYINTGSTVLNLLIGGTRLADGSFVCPGWPRGRISEIFGPESSGKSTIALIALGQALQSRNGEGTGLYVDLEHAVVDSYATKLGADFRPPELGGKGNAMRIAPNYAEEVQSAVNAAAIQGVDLIVIDSVAGLQSKREFMRDVLDPKEKQGIAEIPRFMSNWMSTLQGIIASTGTHVMFLNQTRDKIGAFGFSDEAKKSTTGGNALRFWASNRISLKPKQRVKAKRWNPLTRSEDEVPIATDIEVKNAKNKIDSRQGHTGLITIRYGVGIDEIRTMMNVAIAYDIVSKTKNKSKQEIFQYHSQSGKEMNVVGIERFRAALAKDPELYSEINTIAVEKILQGMRSIDDDELTELAEGAIHTKEGGDMDEDDDEVIDSPAEISPEVMGLNPDEIANIEV